MFDFPIGVVFGFFAGPDGRQTTLIARPRGIGWCVKRGRVGGEKKLWNCGVCGTERSSVVRLSDVRMWKVQEIRLSQWGKMCKKSNEQWADLAIFLWVKIFPWVIKYEVPKKEADYFDQWEQNWEFWCLLWQLFLSNGQKCRIGKKWQSSSWIFRV